MNVTKILALLLPLLLTSFQSPPQAVVDRQEAREKLGKLNVAYNSDAFIESVINGDKDNVELFLAAGMSPDVKYRGKILEIGNHIVGTGDTPLIISLRFHYSEISWMLLEFGANVNEPGYAKCFPLLLAEGSLATALLDRGADVNQRGYAGTTALIWAAEKGNLETLNLLLDRGADIDAQTDSGRTAAMSAAGARKRDAFNLLQARGADVSNFSERQLRIITAAQDPTDEVTRLINKLYSTVTEHSITGPSLVDQEQVPKLLLAIANGSTDSRDKVVDKLIDVVEDPAAKTEPLFATAWTNAVELLGKLRAVEAINVLVRNLDETGQNGIIISIHFRPVQTALARIGEPAAPRLVRALSDPKKSIRTEAAWTLFQVQGARAKDALESAYNDEKDEDVKTVFTDVLERMNSPWPVFR